MLVVVIDTSTPAVTAALVAPWQGRGAASDAAGPGMATGDRPEVVAQRRTVDARAHGELLAPAIAAVLEEGGARPADLTAVVAGLGPGPFTGLRVGLATAAALAQALAIPAYGVCSLDGIGAATAGATLVATDARRREVYWAVYHDGTRVAGPAVNRPGDLAEAVAGAVGAYGGAAVDAAVGDGALRYADALPWPVRPEPRYPAPAVLARLASPRVSAGAPGEVLTPLYLRRPDAVEPGVPKPVTR